MLPPSGTLPGYLRRHFCGECPRHAQPANGFDVAQFAEHHSSHVVAALREVMSDAHHFHYALTMINAKLKSEVTKEWPVTSLRKLIQLEVDNGLRQGHAAEPRSPFT